eukprot:scaffold880_cov384-Prasinococcus_capsulatus_cf.AAC.10
MVGRWSAAAWAWAPRASRPCNSRESKVRQASRTPRPPPPFRIRDQASGRWLGPGGGDQRKRPVMRGLLSTGVESMARRAARARRCGDWEVLL